MDKIEKRLNDIVSGNTEEARRRAAEREVRQAERRRLREARQAELDHRREQRRLRRELSGTAPGAARDEGNSDDEPVPEVYSSDDE